MSLAIDVDTVTRVLLADGWHEVADKSFTMDAYEYMEGTMTLLGGGTEAKAGVPATGFAFKESRDGAAVVLAGPISSIVAVELAQ